MPDVWGPHSVHQKLETAKIRAYIQLGPNLCPVSGEEVVGQYQPCSKQYEAM